MVAFGNVFLINCHEKRTIFTNELTVKLLVEQSVLQKMTNHFEPVSMKYKALENLSNTFKENITNKYDKKESEILIVFYLRRGSIPVGKENRSLKKTLG